MGIPVWPTKRAALRRLQPTDTRDRYYLGLLFYYSARILLPRRVIVTVYGMKTT